MNRNVAVNPHFISRNHLEDIRRRSLSVGAVQTGAKSKLDDRYTAYVREASQKMTQNWSNTIEQKTKRAANERAKGSTKDAENQAAYEAIREKQRREQRAQIEKVENSFRRAKPGPKLLDSAALLSECLHVQQRQREEMVLRNISNREQSLNDGRLLRLQNHQWTLEAQRRHREQQLRAMHYKQDLRSLMQEKRMRQAASAEQQAAQREDEEALRRAVEKEKREMERRKAMMRETATEAMRMAEQRRMREKMEDEVLDGFCTVQLEGNARQQEIRDTQARAIKREQLQRQEAAQEKVSAILVEAAKEEQATEERVLANAAAAYQKQLLDGERAEKERKKKLKAQRIQFYVDEMEREKRRKAQDENVFRESVSNRLTNDRVTYEFEVGQRQKRWQETRELQARLRRQCEEKEAMERAIKAGVQDFTNRQCDYSRDHADFAGYAKEALHLVKDKQRPVQPLVKAICQYERDHFVEEKPLLPHLLVRQPPVYYDRPVQPANNSKEIIRYNIDQLRALNPIIAGYRS